MNAPLTTSIDRVGVAMLEGLHQHRLLSSSQLHALYSPGAVTSRTRSLTAELARWGLVSWVRARTRGGEKLWFLTQRGCSAIDVQTITGDSRRVLVTPESAAGQLQAHTTAVNDVGVAFVLTARAHGHDCGPLAWRHEVTHPISLARGQTRGVESVRADALLKYAITDADVTLISRFIELDRATMPMEDLLAKLRRYARLADFRGDAPMPLWTEHYRALPEVLVIFTGSPRATLERRRKTLSLLARNDQALHRAAQMHGLSLSFAMLEDLQKHGVLAPVFEHWTRPNQRVDFIGRPT